jgi:hypothetical protein
MDFVTFDDIEEDEYDPDDTGEDLNQWDKPVDTIEQGHEYLRAFLRENHGSAYALLSEFDGNLSVRFKIKKPCYGELRPYGSDAREVIHPDQIDTRGQDPKPGDLPGFFPKGHILAVAVCEHDKSYMGPTAVELRDWMFNKERSPWRSLFNHDMEVVERFAGAPEGANTESGYLFKDTKFPPTLFVQFFMLLARMGQYSRNLEFFPVNDPLRPLAAMCMTKAGYGTNQGKLQLTGGPDPYCVSLQQANLSRFLNGQPYDLDGGLTMYDGAAYNRPNIHFTFGHGRENKWLREVSPNVILRNALATPDDNLGFSAKGADPLKKA